MKVKLFGSITGSSNSGKTIRAIHTACDCIKAGFNVLYITLENKEIDIYRKAYTILSNNLCDSLDITKEFDARLIVKEFPTGTVNVNHFRELINGLKNKDNFIPDYIIVDPINCIKSIKNNINSYIELNSIVEELELLSEEINVVIVSVQNTRKEKAV